MNLREAVAKWHQLRPLCLILKVFLQQRELNEVYSGGIGSYALLTMLMVMLRNVRQSQPTAEHNLGVLLMLVYRALEKALFSERVVEGMEWDIFAHKFYNKAQPFLLGIQDPLVLFDELPFIL
ncbi:PAP-associated domain-containing protein 5-like, partial [Trifolium pratense]